MSDETKVVIDFIQSNEAKDRAIIMGIMGILGWIIKMLFSMSKDVEHVKTSVEEMKGEK